MSVQGAQSSHWDQIFEEISAGRAYTRGAKVTGAAAGQGGVELFNPFGSGKEIQVVRAYIGTDAAQSVSFERINAALTTLLGLGHSLLSGLFDSAAELRTDTTVPIPGPTIFTSNTQVRSHVTACDMWGPNLSAGEGYVFFADTVASVLTVRFDWIERDV